jgi:hypothetical protein
MEVLDSCVGLLTNCEVQALFQRSSQQRFDYDEYKVTMKVLFDKISAGSKFRGKAFSDLSEKDKKIIIGANDAQRESRKKKQWEHACWMRKQVTEYCTWTAAGLQTEAHVQQFISRLPTVLKGKTLSESEVLQLVNLRPVTLVEVHRIVEECEDRLAEAEVETLLELVQECLPGKAVVVEDMHEEDEEAEGEEEEGEEQTGQARGEPAEVSMVASQVSMVVSEAPAEESSRRGEGEGDDEDDEEGMEGMEGMEDDDMVEEEKYSARVDDLGEGAEEDM